MFNDLEKLRCSPNFVLFVKCLDERLTKQLLCRDSIKSRPLGVSF